MVQLAVEPVAQEFVWDQNLRSQGNSPRSTGAGATGFGSFESETG